MFRTSGGRAACAVMLAACASCSLVDGLGDQRSAADGGAPAGDARPVECIEGNRITGASVFNASPVDPDSACAVDNALVRDGSVAGLDLLADTGDACGALSPADPSEGGCGCVGIDFGAAHDLAAILVRAAPIGDACGRACDGSDCGTGHSFVAWYGVEPDVWTLAGDPDMVSDQLIDYELEIGEPVRFVAVCREWWGASRDDVTVDSIEGVCGP